MALFRKIRTAYHADPALRSLFWQAYLLSALVRFTLVFLPFRKVLAWQGKINVETPSGPDEASAGFRKTLQSAMRLCDQYTIWKTECYTQAVTAKILLGRKGLPGTVYIGFRKNEDGKYAGHAWLRSFDRIITGREGMENYVVHSFYS
ncbi:MAG: lasso peptide biosynthesis B2 protein [Chitinophagaceae bacterium]|jgi:hypothetical protein|nr:lasso peptide biosynthesis B2 protein [Chitinophagaceae bacterium]